jgi:DNA modification methylase
MATIKRGKIEDLKPDSRNANLHSKKGMALLDKSLLSLGAGRSVLVSDNNELIAGNGVVERAKAAGIENVLFVETTGKDLVVVRRTDIKAGSPEFYQMALADNIVAKENIVLDAEVIEALSEEIEGVKDWAEEFLSPSDPEKINPVEEDEFEEKVIVNPLSSLGDLYELNQHRVQCADSKNPETLKSLMGGKVADLVFTDPPYGQDTELEGYGRGELGRRAIIGDESTETAIVGCNNSFVHLKQNSHFLCFIQWKTYSEIEAAIKSLGLKIKSVIVWDKKSPGLGAGVSEQHEFIIVAIKGTAVQRHFIGNVWSIARVSGKRSESEHPHKKPLELLGRGLDLTIEREQMVLDPFLGSGSTLLACDSTGRACYGQEIDPVNVDNIVLRWLTYMKKNNNPVEQIKRNGKNVLKEFEKLLNEKNKN